MKTTQGWFAAATALALLATAATASAQPVDDATRGAARVVAEEGLALFDKGSYAEALEKFNRADAIMHAPTLGLHAARCLAKLGKLVEASERYRAVTLMSLDATASDAQRAAQPTATKEREALLPRIASVEIGLEGAAPTEAEVTLDGAPMPAMLIGLKRPMNPGAHHLAAKRGAEVATQDFTLREGEATRVVVKLLGASAVPLAPGVTPSPSAPKDTAPSASSPLRTAGWVGIGVGGAGLVLGAITGGMALGVKSTLDTEGCTASHICPAAATSDVNRLATLRTVSSVGFIAGGVLAAAGGVLVWRGSTRLAPAHAGVAPWIGAGSAGLAGSF